jgi:hypothetical protein
LIDGHSGVGDDAAEGAHTDLLVVGHDDPGMRLVAAENHVAATLEHDPEKWNRFSEKIMLKQKANGGIQNLPVPGRPSLLGQTGR